ncbi:MAG: hypothetical protein OK438_05780 [Thaumarchaeota archaeon]|nr:hypothetical protein [Nitrososphaerota archaeon]
MKSSTAILIVVAVFLVMVSVLGVVIYLKNGASIFQGNVRISGSFTATTGYEPTPTRIDFTSGSGKNYSAYAMNIQGSTAQYAVDLPNNALYHVTVVSTPYNGPPNHCDAGTIHVYGSNAAENVIC